MAGRTWREFGLPAGLWQHRDARTCRGPVPVCLCFLFAEEGSEGDDTLSVQVLVLETPARSEAGITDEQHIPRSRTQNRSQLWERFSNFSRRNNQLGSLLMPHNLRLEPRDLFLPRSRAQEPALDTHMSKDRNSGAECSGFTLRNTNIGRRRWDLNL